MSERVRVVSWNIRAGGGSRVEEIASALAGWGADVAALSEVRGTPPSLRLGELLAARGLRHRVSTADRREPRANGCWPPRAGRCGRCGCGPRPGSGAAG